MRFSSYRLCRSLWAALLVTTTLLGVGCSRHIGIAISDVSVMAWEESVTLCFENEQPRRCDVNIIMHINRTYIADSIELDICTMTPDSLRHKESIKFATPIEWRGAKATSTDLEIPYRQNVELGHEGSYHFEISPRSTVRGIEAIGLHFRAREGSEELKPE